MIPAHHSQLLALHNLDSILAAKIDGPRQTPQLSFYSTTRRCALFIACNQPIHLSWLIWTLVVEPAPQEAAST